VCAEPYGFWLDSAVDDPRMARVSYWGAEPAVVLRSRGRRVTIDRRYGATERFEADPFDVLRDLLAERGAVREGMAAGYFGFGLKQHIERLPDTVADDQQLPDLHLAFYDRAHAFDPRPLLPPAPPTGLPPVFDGLTATWTRAAYEAAVERALAYIRAGEIYQVNLAQRFAAPLAGRSPFDTYLRLRAQSPAPFAAYLSFPGYAVMSSSPERFLRYDPDTRDIETRPIKGTRPRGPGPKTDRALAGELLASEKDRAENVMIVDLARNDLGRVAEIGSVCVAGLCDLESYATVHHLVSTVRARLRPDVDAVDVLRASFPPGSVTGAPKIRSLEIIDELEPVARGVYTGAIGYMRASGELDLSVAIRVMVASGGVASFHVGGAIVADSRPDDEYEETLHKGAALARVLLGEGR
jgi:para-aminobenzoate synthetase component 1